MGRCCCRPPPRFCCDVGAARGRTRRRDAAADRSRQTVWFIGRKALSDGHERTAGPPSPTPLPRRTQTLTHTYLRKQRRSCPRGRRLLRLPRSQLPFKSLCPLLGLDSGDDRGAPFLAEAVAVGLCGVWVNVCVCVRAAVGSQLSNACVQTDGPDESTSYLQLPPFRLPPFLRRQQGRLPLPQRLHLSHRQRHTTTTGG